MSGRDFALVFSFDIDDGQLDGLTPQQCFVLGYELCGVMEQLRKNRKPFSVLIHAENRERAMKACKQKYRAAQVQWADDSSEDWCMLNVEEAY